MKHAVYDRISEISIATKGMRQVETRIRCRAPKKYLECEELTSENPERGEGRSSVDDRGTFTVHFVRPFTFYSIQWLSLSGCRWPAVFAKVAFIHRLHTVGGNVPSNSGSVVGEERRMPYTADYLFYKAP